MNLNYPQIICICSYRYKISLNVLCGAFVLNDKYAGC